MTILSKDALKTFLEEVELKEVLKEALKGALGEELEEVLEEADLQEGKERAPGQVERRQGRWWQH